MSSDATAPASSGTAVPAGLLPGAEPFRHDGGPVGVLVSHGFTGTPASMRPWAQHLADAGYTVRLPLLPGHGTHWRHLNRVRWQDWYDEILAAHDELAGRCEQVFACALSMGGALITKLAIDRPGALGGLVLVNPALGLARLDAKFARYVAWAVRSKSGIGSDIKSGGVESGYDRTPLLGFVQMQNMWREIVPALPRLTTPVLLYTSRVDHVVDPLSARLLLQRATNTTIERVWLEDSWHVATLDNDAQTIFDCSVEFIAGLTRAGTAGAP